MEKGTRIEEARRRLRTTRRSIGVAAGIAFAGVALVARAAHPGTSQHASSNSTPSATSTASTSSSSDDTFFDDGGATFSESQSSTAQTQSGGS
jgi:hypothetical protein